MNKILRNLRPLFTPQMCLIWLVSLWLMLTSNHALFNQLLKLYPWEPGHRGFMVSLALLFTFSTTWWLMLLSHGRAARWVLALILLSGAWAAFYMDEFGVIIDHVMLENAAQTDAREILGLLSWGFAFKLVGLGLLPAALLFFKAPKRCFAADPWRLRLKHMGLLLLGMALLMAPFTADYTTFIREHKIVRMYANPTFFHYSLLKWGSKKLFTRRISGLETTPVTASNAPPRPHHALMIVVVGETARFDRFSLNGYARPTNPRLSQEQVVSFQDVRSCGTSTAVSVPCMFSAMTRKQYDEEKALHKQNALDLLSAHGVRVLWRDNNSDSKGVALRVPYEDFKSQAYNPVCESNECRDIGMLSGLDKFVTKNQDHDMLIVLHQMGNHGPEYYRRYPDQFKQFTPICKSGRLSECSQQEIDNAYDNAILYTDYFLSEVIQFLKRYDSRYETAMLYVADHGESLGEHGIFLHAAPYQIAPLEQIHVPAILWLGQQSAYSLSQVKPHANDALSHDDLFCTLMTTYGLKSEVCQAEAGWLATARDSHQDVDKKRQALTGGRY